MLATNEAVVPLLIGTVLALAAASFVLIPLLGEDESSDGLPSTHTSNPEAAAYRMTPSSDTPAAMPSEKPDAASDPVEAAIRRASETLRQCRSCGPRPEPDATYCSQCGHYLKEACAECGAGIEEAAAHFCSRCGVALASA